MTSKLSWWDGYGRTSTNQKLIIWLVLKLTKISIVIFIFYIAFWFLYLVFIVLWNKQNTLQFILSTTDGASNLVSLDSWFFSKDENCVNKLTGPIKIWYGPIISHCWNYLIWNSLIILHHNKTIYIPIYVFYTTVLKLML